MWDLPGPGLEPVSPALAGGFPTTEPPGKPNTDSSDKGIRNKSFRELVLFSQGVYFCVIMQYEESELN